MKLVSFEFLKKEVKGRKADFNLGLKGIWSITVGKYGRRGMRHMVTSCPQSGLFSPFYSVIGMGVFYMILHHVKLTSNINKPNINKAKDQSYRNDKITNRILLDEEEFKREVPFFVS